MDEIKLSEGARAGLLAMDAGAYLMGSQRRGMPQYRLSGRLVSNPGDFEELRRHKLLEQKTLPPANREVELRLTDRGKKEAERLRSEQQGGGNGG
ncbi:MAG: hypothetical protein ACJ76N_12480 [Thermoanaerobaculia bacterium]